MVVLAIDPGKAKIGVAILDEKRKVLYRDIWKVDNDLEKKMKDLAKKWKVDVIAVGNSTHSEEIVKILNFSLAYPLIYVEERNSTLEARKIYFKENPPSCWMKFLPRGLWIPPRDIDDYAAVIIANRYLDKFRREQ